MPEPREPRSIVEAAEQSAAAGDYASAERLLREAADLQEATLGPLHPDLANTLNNLGVIYERVDSPAEAELCYRRAYAIATKALAPSHPFVATSRKNLEEFCRARGRPFDRTSVAPERVPLRKPARRSFRPVLVGAVGALAVAMLVVAALWFRSSAAIDTAAPSAAETVTGRQPSTPPGNPVDPGQKRQQVANEANTPLARDSHGSTANDGKSAAPQSRTAVPRERRAPETLAPAVVTIAEAHLCRRLSTRDWRCDQASSPVTPGLLFFYTRVNASTNTTIEHRWYRDDRLSQSVDLRIQASPGSGYRTYSRRTVSAENAGNWRVEVRTQDGSVLHEERFVVR